MYLNMRTKIQAIALLLLMLASASCANMGLIMQNMNPEEVSKEELKKLHAETTPKYGFKVAKDGNVNADMSEILENVDYQFTEFSECFSIKDGGEKAREYMIAVVNGTFRCEFYFGSCNGEYDGDYGLIIVSYKAFSRKGILPVLKHEWAHVYGLLRDDHQNLKDVKWCTRY
jgi:hypothetical protein